MLRRHDSLSRMALTLLAALLCGAVFEAEGLHTWAERLSIGPLRDVALPATATWRGWTAPLHLEQPRVSLLAMKANLAPVMLAQQAAPTPSVSSSVASSTSLPTSSPAPLSAPSPAPDALAPVPALVARTAVLDASVAAQPTPALVSASPAPADPAKLAAAPVANDDVKLNVPANGINVALAGDSMMAVGLAPTLKRWLAEQEHVRVIPAYRSGTGLARPEVFDWIAEYPRMLGQAKPAIVICAMGANDAQSVQVGRQVLQFDTPEWDAFFRARLSAYLDVLTKEKPHVLWVGMPPMRSKEFSAKMAHLNELLKSTLARYPNTTWLDPTPAMAGPEGPGFQQFRAQRNGKMVKLRADDGIHLTDDGALFLLPPIRHWMAQAVDQNAPPKPVFATAPPALATDPAPSLDTAPILALAKQTAARH